MKQYLIKKMELAVLNVRGLLTDEHGEGHIVAVVVVALIVLGLAVTFRTKITDILTGLLGKAENAAQTF